MFIEIIQASHPTVWYKNYVFHCIEVYEDKNRPNLYLVTPKQLKDLGKDEKSEFAILKQDCSLIFKRGW